MQQHRQVPEFFRQKCQDFAFAFTDHAQCDRLHTAGAGAFFHLRPEQRTDHITDQPVKHPARLLRINQIHIDFGGILERLFDGALGNFVKGHPLEFAFKRPFEQFLQMPGNGFSFTVRVGGQINAVRLFRGGFDLFHHFRAARILHIHRRKMILDIHPDGPLRQIAHMSH